MRKEELQRKATILIKQLSAKELNEVIDYLSNIQDKKNSGTSNRTISLLAEGGAATDSETVSPKELKSANRTRDTQLESKSAPQPTEKNASAQRLIKAMGQPSHVTPYDIKFLIKVIKEAKQSTRNKSPFDGIEELEAQ